jgi:hypothetical protein
MKTKQSSSKMSASAVFFHKHWWKIGVIILLISSLTFLGYNKYLDQQNVNNMKQLLADFEQLKTDVEAETGEKLALGTSCNNIEEKFVSTPSCYVYLEGDELKIRSLSSKLNSSIPESLEKNKSCSRYGEIGFVFNNSKKVLFSCYPLVIRSNVQVEVYGLMKTYE